MTKKELKNDIFKIIENLSIDDYYSFINKLNYHFPDYIGNFYNKNELNEFEIDMLCGGDDYEYFYIDENQILIFKDIKNIFKDINIKNIINKIISNHDRKTIQNFFK